MISLSKVERKALPSRSKSKSCKACITATLAQTSYFFMVPWGYTRIKNQPPGPTTKILNRNEISQETLDKVPKRAAPPLVVAVRPKDDEVEGLDFDRQLGS